MGHYCLIRGESIHFFLLNPSIKLSIEIHSLSNPNNYPDFCCNLCPIQLSISAQLVQEPKPKGKQTLQYVNWKYNIQNTITRIAAKQHQIEA